MKSSKHILLVSSSGGHLAQLYSLKPWWSKYDRLWVTFDTQDANSRLSGESIRYAYHPTTRSLKNLIRNALLALHVLADYGADLVVSTGAGVAVPFFIVARSKRIPTAYIEVIDRINSPTLTGRLCYPLSSRFLLQWEGQKKFYPNGILIGPLL